MTSQDLIQLAEKRQFKTLFKHLDTFFNKELNEDYNTLRHKILYELIQGNTLQTSYLYDLEIFLSKAAIDVTLSPTETAPPKRLIKEAILAAIYNNPNDCEAWYNLGEIYTYENDLEKSFDAYSQALIIQPNHTESLCKLGDYYVILGNNSLNTEHYHQAISLYLKVIENDPNHYETWLSLAWCYRQLGEYEAGLNAHCKAIEINPTLTKGWYSLRDFYAKFNEYQKVKHISHFLIHD